MDRTTLAAVIVPLIVEHPACLLCLSAKVGETKLTTLRAIERIARSLRLEHGGACRSCGSELGPVYSLSRHR